MTPRTHDRARVVMSPKAPPAKVRGPMRYWDLFKEVEEGWPFGTWVLMLSFKGREHVYKVKNKLARGEYKMPGGKRAWEMRVEIEYVDGVATTGNLYVRRKK